MSPTRCFRRPATSLDTRDSEAFPEGKPLLVEVGQCLQEFQPQTVALSRRLGGRLRGRFHVIDLQLRRIHTNEVEPVGRPRRLLDREFRRDLGQALATAGSGREPVGRLQVALFDTVPVGGGQALQLLADRGVKIAVTAAAAATADPGDLYGWQRWAIVLPPRMVSGPHGVDGLLIQQTVSAIASSETRLIAVTDRPLDSGALEEYGISWVLDRSAPGMPIDDAIVPAKASRNR